MNTLLDALVTGLPLVPAFMGIYLVFVMRSDFDLTVEQSFALGGSVSALLLLSGTPALLAMLASIVVGALLGTGTAILHHLLQIPIILAGLIMAIGMYSVNLRLLGSPTLSLAGTETLLSRAQALPRPRSDLAVVLVLTVIVVLVLALVSWFLLTDRGLTVRMSGINPALARSLGIDDRVSTGLSLMIANGLVGLGGSLVVQNQGFTDVSLGNGLLLAGIGAVLLGQLVIRSHRSGVALAIVAVAIGSIAYRLILSGALRLGLEASDLKGVTALTLIAVFALRRSGLRSYARRRTGLDA